MNLESNHSTLTPLPPLEGSEKIMISVIKCGQGWFEYIIKNYFVPSILWHVYIPLVRTITSDWTAWDSGSARQRGGSIMCWSGSWSGKRWRKKDWSGSWKRKWSLDRFRKLPGGSWWNEEIAPQICSVSRSKRPTGHCTMIWDKENGVV